MLHTSKGAGRTAGYGKLSGAGSTMVEQAGRGRFRLLVLERGGPIGLPVGGGKST